MNQNRLLSNRLFCPCWSERVQSNDTQITIGDNFYMNANCYFLENIKIGRDVMLVLKHLLGGETMKWDWACQ